MGGWKDLYWVGRSACSGIERKIYSYYLYCKKSISTRCSLKAVPFPSACSVELNRTGFVKLQTV